MHQIHVAGVGWRGRVWLPGWLVGRAERAGRAWLADFSTEFFVRNVAVCTCKYTKYTKIIILTIGLDTHGPGYVNSVAQITLTPHGDSAVVSLQKYL